MVKQLYNVLILCFLMTLSGCEELIDVDLNEVDPRIVIVADLNNEESEHVVLVSRTVNFDEPRPSEPISDAIVFVESGNGKRYDFKLNTEGEYVNSNLPLSVGETYTLNVIVNGEQYTSTTKMLGYIEIDSIGVTKENLFSEDFYFINLKFSDPQGQPNYYRYGMSINNQPFKFNMVASDKYNDGNEVTHQLGGQGANNEIKPGDHILVRRYIITKEVYTYWSEYMSTNPGSAAPGNPTSNINNGALGFFSVSSVRDYTVDIDEEPEIPDDSENPSE